MKLAIPQLFMSILFCAFLSIQFSVEAASVRVSAQTAIPNSESLFAPIAMGAPAGDSQHLYVAYRKHARIWVHDRDTGARLNPFLDLPDTTGSQEGLLSFAFHPDYDTNGLFYTYVYRNADHEGRVVEHKRSDSNPLEADPSYERQILTLPNNNSHNGGWIGFSPDDGYLYLTTGDGGANQGANNGLLAQDVNDVHGKILRFDISGDDFPADTDRNYAIPATNPFAVSGGAPEIFALGLRHPFRASFDRETSDLYIGDVGAGLREEIDFLPAGTNGGQNYGWRALEGTLDNPSTSDPAPAGAIDPIHEYPNIGGAAVIGGHVYRGSVSPALDGTYFFAEFVQREISSFKYDGSSLADLTDRTSQLFPGGIPIGSVTAFGEDGLGEVYIVTDGAIYRIEGHFDGDYNRDGAVDAADYTVWRDNQNSSVASAYDGADGDGDGVIGAGDYDVWRDNFGASITASVAIPEPTSLFLAALAMFTIPRRRVSRTL